MEPIQDEEWERVARLMYRLEGWERWWPFEKMPGWLAAKFKQEGRR
jgi:hypothetical protein